jgi:hypothetical protein
MKGVGSRLSVVEVRWGDPFGGTVFAFAGSPSVGFDQGMIGPAGQGQRVDVGALRGGPFVDMMDLTPVPAHVAARAGAAAVLGMNVLMMRF